MTSGLTRRFLFLRASRWLPTGFFIPVFTLFVLSKGFTLREYGAALAAQSVLVLLLELPTGGLADVVGARPVLILAAMADIASIGLLIVADSFAVLVVVWAIQGVYRALESGPLEAWYVTAVLEIDPEADIERDMARAGTTLGLAIACGSLLSSGLVLAAPRFGVEPLLLPVVVALILRVADLTAILALMTSPPAGRTTAASTGTVRQKVTMLAATLAQVPTVVRDAAAMIRRSLPLAALLGVELLWGFGMFGFETLFPARLSDVVNDPERAAAILGPLGTGAWLLSAAGSAGTPLLSRRWGPQRTAALLRILQGATVLALAVLAGPIGLIIAYLATLMVHGASNAVHSGLLHANTSSSHRTTVLSANSMAANLGGGIGSVVLGLVASGSGLAPAMAIAAFILAMAAPLYFVRERQDPKLRATPIPSP